RVAGSARETDGRLENAVDAKPDGHLFLGRLQVNVGGAELDGVVNHLERGLVAARLLDLRHPAVGGTFLIALADATNADAPYLFLLRWRLHPQIACGQPAEMAPRQHLVFVIDFLIAEIAVSDCWREVEG